MVSKWPIWDTFVTERNLLDGSRVTHVKWAVTERHQRDQLLYSSAMVPHARRRPNVRRSLCWISWTLIQVNWHRENPNHFFTETVMVFEIRSADIWWWWWRRRAWRWWRSLCKMYHVGRGSLGFGFWKLESQQLLMMTTKPGDAGDSLQSISTMSVQFPHPTFD